MKLLPGRVIDPGHVADQREHAIQLRKIADLHRQQHARGRIAACSIGGCDIDAFAREDLGDVAQQSRAVAGFDDDVDRERCLCGDSPVRCDQPFGHQPFHIRAAPAVYGDPTAARHENLIAEPKTIEHWLEIYAKSTYSEIPALAGRLKSIESEIESKTRRVNNLVSRIAELPADISADAFYQQIKETNQKILEFKSAKAELLSKSVNLKDQVIHKDGLIDKIRRTVEKLELTPIELRKPIYSNLIKFAELYPTKIKVGVYAPTESFNYDEQTQMKATGTDGVPSKVSKFKCVKAEPKILDFVKRGGSTSVTIGAPRGT